MCCLVASKAKNKFCREKARKRVDSFVVVAALLERRRRQLFPGKISAWSRGRRTVSASAVIFYLEVLKLLHTLALCSSSGSGAAERKTFHFNKVWHYQQ